MRNIWERLKKRKVDYNGKKENSKKEEISRFNFGVIFVSDFNPHLIF